MKHLRTYQLFESRFIDEYHELLLLSREIISRYITSPELYRRDSHLWRCFAVMDLNNHGSVRPDLIQVIEEYEPIFQERSGKQLEYDTFFAKYENDPKYNQWSVKFLENSLGIDKWLALICYSVTHGNVSVDEIEKAISDNFNADWEEVEP